VEAETKRRASCAAHRCLWSSHSVSRELVPVKAGRMLSLWYRMAPSRGGLGAGVSRDGSFRLRTYTAAQVVFTAMCHPRAAGTATPSPWGKITCRQQVFGPQSRSHTTVTGVCPLHCHTGPQSITEWRSHPRRALW